ncbi:rRNA accumulation-related protein [Halocaridina rubra]|uniref:Pre-rRNA-processing protein TSR2 homolog n=1 Tax=Halocaridina rubra TaxID=373956 RepID=A0AAN8ZY38_HALRR
MYPVFKDAVASSLSNWNALQFAVQQETGGPESKTIADWMVGVVEQFFYENDDLDPDEVADFLSTVMDQELNTHVEDQSDCELGQLLCRFFKLCASGQESQVLDEISKMPKITLGSCNIQEDSCKENDSAAYSVEAGFSSLHLNGESSNTYESMHEEPARELTDLEKQQQQDEADGWTVIRKGNRKR